MCCVCCVATATVSASASVLSPFGLDPISSHYEMPLYTILIIFCLCLGWIRPGDRPLPQHSSTQRHTITRRRRRRSCIHTRILLCRLKWLGNGAGTGTGTGWMNVGTTFVYTPPAARMYITVYSSGFAKKTKRDYNFAHSIARVPSVCLNYMFGVSNCRAMNRFMLIDIGWLWW